MSITPPGRSGANAGDMAQPRPRSTHPVLVLAAIFVLFVLANVINVLIYRILIGAGLNPAHEELTPLESGSLQALRLIVPFGTTALLVLLLIVAGERRSLAEFGFRRSAFPSRYGSGFLLGLACFSATVVLLGAMGTLDVDGGKPARTGFYALGGVVVVLAGWVVQGASEEIACRGWLLQSIGRRWGNPTAIVVSSALFAILHGLNPNVAVLAVLNIFLVGIVLGCFAVREGGLWGVCAWHSAWNWAQGNIFGLEVSGNVAAGGTVVDLSEHGPALATGGAFGPEGGLAATVVIVGFGFWLMRKPRARQDPTEGEKGQTAVDASRGGSD